MVGHNRYRYVDAVCATDRKHGPVGPCLQSQLVAGAATAIVVALTYVFAPLVLSSAREELMLMCTRCVHAVYQRGAARSATMGTTRVERWACV